jgi:hypothetical protein
MQKRAVIIPNSLMHEAGYFACAWVCPLEKFQSMPVIDSGRHANKHGAFVYFRDDGEAYAFLVDPLKKIDSCSDMEWISDGFVSRHSYDITNRALWECTNRALRKCINRALEDDVIFKWHDKAFRQTVKTMEDLGKIPDGRDDIHKACHAGMSHTIVKTLLHQIVKN